MTIIELVIMLLEEGHCKGFIEALDMLGLKED